MTFQSDLTAFAQKTGIRFDRIVRKVCIDLMADLVKLTPVDTGMARSNWFAGSSRVSSTDTTASKNGAPSMRRASEFAATLHGGVVFFITNNLPYIMQLEYGSSTQAPHGMARTTVARWQKMVHSIAGAV